MDWRKYLTLDWDYYNIPYILNHWATIVFYIETRTRHIKVLESEKGFNVILELNYDQGTFYFHLVDRLILGDDLFRIRHDLEKWLWKQEHRVNRIWEEKNGKKKKVVFDISSVEFHNISTKLYDVLKNKYLLLKSAGDKQ